MKYPLSITFTVVLIILLVLLTGCSTTTATFEDGKVTVDSRNVVAEQVEKPDGTLKTTIDTTQRSWWDGFRRGVSNFFKAVAGIGSRGSVNMGG